MKPLKHNFRNLSAVYLSFKVGAFVARLQTCRIDNKRRRILSYSAGSWKPSDIRACISRRVTWRNTVLRQCIQLYLFTSEHLLAGVPHNDHRRHCPDVANTNRVVPVLRLQTNCRERKGWENEQKVSRSAAHQHIVGHFVPNNDEQDDSLVNKDDENEM